MRRMLGLLVLLVIGIAPTLPAQSTPTEVVKAFYAACNDGSYSKAEKLATKESIDYLKATFALAGSVKGYCDQLTEEGTLVRLEITGEKVRGEGARVTFNFHFKGGRSEPGEEALVKTEAGWRVQVLGQAK